MKKILLFVCSALLIGFSSCSSDDDNGDSPQSPSKKLSKIEEYDDNGDLVGVETFSYDNLGRWIKAEYETISGWNGEKPNNRIRTLTYSDNKIQYSESYYDSYTEIFTLKNNLITSRYEEGYKDDAYNYQYSNGYLIKIGEDYVDFEYTNGNLTKSKEYQNYTISYTNIADKLGFNILEPSFNDGDVVEVFPNNPLYQFGYLGKRSMNLIQSIKSNYSSLDGYSYSYTLDKDGYVTEMEKRRNGGGYSTYKFYY